MAKRRTVSSGPSLALYGAGMISIAHAAAARINRIPITAVASRSAERAQNQAQRLHVPAAAYADLPGDASIVAVSTPPQCHAADALAMLASGAAVVLEKPLCTTLADADALVDAAGHRLLYAESLAYSPLVQAMLAAVPRLGAVERVEVRTIQSLPTWGEFTSDAWGGGALFDLGVHPLAVALLVAGAAGAGQPRSVTCTLRGGPGHNSDEHAEVAITFANGLVALVTASWQAARVLGRDGQVWDVQASSPTGVLRGDFFPTPTLEHNGDPVALAGVADEQAAVIEGFGYAGQLRSFVADLAAQRTPLMDAAFGRFVLDIVCAAYRSAGREGAAEALPFRGDRTLTPLQLWRGGPTAD
ncbi:MAG TPA: Gfo/Idh/MocA family oxidoreductase [Ilumatobacteraceae bacterium]|nr:Gfo/Idh/MocA family oxidoreductase [Ilumatobacteraceae bacterium]